MTSETKATDKPGDPADKAADGAFGGVTTHSHRAGYGDDRLERLIAYLRLHPTATLASGEGGMLVQHILLLRARIEGMSEGAKVYEDHYADARAEIDRLRNELKTQTETVQYLIGERTADREHWGAIEDSLNRAERILAALREPSEVVVDTMVMTLYPDIERSKLIQYLTPLLYNAHREAIRAAVAAAEQEVGP